MSQTFVEICQAVVITIAGHRSITVRQPGLIERSPLLDEHRAILRSLGNRAEPARTGVQGARAIEGGLFVTFEGVEGAGKSTQVRLLHEYLSNTMIPFVFTREPGGTPLGEKLRTLLIDPLGMQGCLRPKQREGALGAAPHDGPGDVSRLGDRTVAILPGCATLIRK